MMLNNMNLGIYSVEKTIFEGEVKEIIAKTTTGEISVLQNHIPLVTKLVAAPLRVVKQNGEEEAFQINSGFLEVQPEHSVVVLVDN